MASATRLMTSASGSSFASRQTSRNRWRWSGDRLTASRSGRSTVTFQYPNAWLGKIFDCSLSSKARKVSQMRRISVSDSSQFFLPRFLRSGWYHWVASIS